MDRSTIRARIERALAQEYDETTRRDIAFHLTDWHVELRALVRLFDDPASASDEEISAVLMDFLVHAPAHIAAAAKLYTGNPVNDVFGIGAVAP